MFAGRSRPAAGDSAAPAARQEAPRFNRDKPQRLHCSADAARITGCRRQPDQVKQRIGAYCFHATYNAFHLLSKRIGIALRKFGLRLLKSLHPTHVTARLKGGIAGRSSRTIRPHELSHLIGEVLENSGECEPLSVAHDPVGAFITAAVTRSLCDPAPRLEPMRACVVGWIVQWRKPRNLHTPAGGPSR
jgi:hypothetical protein